jgi:hypothetical protein
VTKLPYAWLVPSFLYYPEQIIDKCTYITVCNHDLDLHFQPSPQSSNIIALAKKYETFSHSSGHVIDTGAAIEQLIEL